MNSDSTLAGRLERLTGFSAVFEAPGFIGVAYGDGWVRGDVAWVEWSKTPKAKNLRDNPEVLATATVDELAVLITILVRQERFVEGSLMSAFESGMVLGSCGGWGVLMEGANI